MNKQTDPKIIVRATRFVFALLAGMVLIPTIHAQPAVMGVDNRFLLIFDTSADMKKRVPAVQKTLNTLLATSLNGQLHSGDSLGVWTFGQELRTGEFPLQHWESADAVMIASNINKFASRQHYAKTTSFNALQPLLNELVQGSERLTIIIFCDGEAPISGTVFDTGINQIFQQRQREFKKARQPVVIVLRSQLGAYSGCTVSFPPAAVNLPQFPPWPPPEPKPTTIIPPPAPAVVPSLFIVGKNVGTNSPPSGAEPTNSPPPAPTVVVPTKITNTVPVPPENSFAPTNAVERTNAVALPAENPAANGKAPLVIGALLFVAAIALGIFVRLRSRRKDSSLITRSMNDRK
jgi:hypothetical protein